MTDRQRPSPAQAARRSPKAAPATEAPLDDALARYPLPTWRPAALIAMTALVGGAIWAAATEIDRITIAPGVVAPVGQIRTVQHPEGGVVDQILIQEGDRVAAGQTLLRIDLGVGGLKASEIRVRLDALRLERARLLAESAQLDLHLPETEAGRQPDLAAAERAAFRSRKRAHESTVAVLRDQRRQRELDVDAISSRLEATKARREPLEKEFEIIAHLAAQGLSTKTGSLKVEGELKKLTGEIEALEIALPLAKTALTEAKERELQERNRFRNEASERLREVESEIARQRELEDRARSRDETAAIASPIDGVVKRLEVNTIGGVIAAGAPIVEIVPVSEKLIIEAKIAPTDIGHVAVGQPARVKVATYDYMIYGALQGRIVRIAADATQTPDGPPFFRAVIETERDYLLHQGERYRISPGMTAEVDLALGVRSVARYLIEPVLKLGAEAMRNR